MLSVLKKRNFALLWVGHALSLLGEATFYIALVWLTLDLTGSAAAMGTVMVCMTVPRVLLQALGGVTGDRYDRRSIILFTNLLRALIMFAFTALVATRRITIVHLYLLAAGFGLCNAFFMPARDALIPTLAGEDGIVPASSLMMATMQLSNTLGPALGGFLLALPAIGTSGVAALNGLFFLAGSLALWLIRLPGKSNCSTPDTSLAVLWSEMLDGFRYISRHSVLVALLVLSAMLNLLFAPLAVLLPVFARQVLHLDSVGYGLLETSFSAGLLGGSVLIGLLARIRRRGLVVIFSIITLGLFFALLPLTRNQPLAMLLLLLGGLVIGAANVIFMALLQMLIEDGFRARAIGISSMVSGCLQPIGMGLSGMLADAFGTTTVMLGCALTTSAVALLSLLNRPLRTLD